MKEIVLSLLTVPGILIVIYFLGIISSGYKKKIKYFSSCLFVMFIISLPIFGKIFSYPLLGLPKLLISDNFNDLEALFYLLEEFLKSY